MFVFCDNPLFCNRYENRSSFGITNQTCFCVGLVLFLSQIWKWIVFRYYQDLFFLLFEIK